MKRLARAAVLTTLRDKLEEHDSWCGETHLQKAAYLLQSATRVPLGFDFVLYKFGPFSFDLRAELTELRSDGLIALVPQGYPYGPRLMSTTLADQLHEKFPRTLKTYGPAIDAVADRVAARGVVSLERFATAVMLHVAQPGADVQEIADELRSVKPHVSETLALEAAEEAAEFLAGEARSAVAAH